MIHLAEWIVSSVVVLFTAFLALCVLVYVIAHLWDWNEEQLRKEKESRLYRWIQRH